MKNIIVGTAGHIDHGKTSLVKALTGIDTDRLKEEKQRGISIDIGFASLKIDDYLFSFIDLPGHERFIKNMLAGAHGIDLVLLVVAADESVMPQTQEHFDICRLLQVKSGLVALTKKDLVDDELLELVKTEVSEFVSGSFLNPTPIPISTKTGEGLDKLKSALVKLAQSVQQRNTRSVARLPIDRAFTIKGFGTVVTGTLVSGTLHLGDEIEILPEGISSHIRSIQVHGQSVEVAYAGQRTAVNLQNLALDKLYRGQVLLPPGRYQPTRIINCSLELLATVPKPLKNYSTVRLHLSTSETNARVILEKASLDPGAKQYAQLKLNLPIFALPGDRFIIRSLSPPITIGGGTVIDTTNHNKHLLQKLYQADSSERLALIVEARAERGITVQELAKVTDLTMSDLYELLSGLSHRILRLEDLLFSKVAYSKLVQKLVTYVADYHQQDPLAAGINRELVYQLISRNRQTAELVLEKVLQDRLLIAEKELLRLPTHRVQLAAEEQALTKALEDFFFNFGYQAATYKDAEANISADSQLLRKLFQLLVRQGVLIRIEEFVFHRKHIEKLIATLRQLEITKLDITTFKNLAGITRKHAIPLLEYLDSIRVTRRMGNEREILKGAEEC